MAGGQLQEEHWRKNGQWFSLTRAHAELVVADAEVADAFKRCGWAQGGLTIRAPRVRRLAACRARMSLPQESCAACAVKSSMGCMAARRPRRGGLPRRAVNALQTRLARRAGSAGSTRRRRTAASGPAASASRTSTTSPRCWRRRGARMRPTARRALALLTRPVAGLRQCACGRPGAS